MHRLLIAACLIAGCGDNQLGDGVPLAGTHDLVIVAHQDDDLLFMQPDLIEAVQAGTGITNVYVTAGNGKKGTQAANRRYRGLMEAYGAAAGDQDWTCGWIELHHRAAQHCRLEAENVSLVFLGYPDGGKYGELPNSLLKLWQGDISTATTVADRTAVYDRDALIDVVAEIAHQTQPAVVRTLDLTAGHGRDHLDHLIVGALTTLALARTDADPELIAYRGYDMEVEPQNKIPAIYAAASKILGYYEACAASGCEVPCGQSCANIDTSHAIWLGRRYAIGVRRSAHGRLRTPTGCLAGATITACEGAPEWVLEHGHL
ncbi:MAG: PIG-L family deacetylase, partial [Kofleriaceae bacterium]